MIQHEHMEAIWMRLCAAENSGGGSEVNWPEREGSDPGVGLGVGGQVEFRVEVL